MKCVNQKQKGDEIFVAIQTDVELVLGIAIFLCRMCKGADSGPFGYGTEQPQLAGQS